MAPFFHRLLLCLVLVLHLPFLISSQSYTNITLGSSISTTDGKPYWTSPSAEFAFGFRPHPGQQELFLLAIWFDLIPLKTIVWTANEGNPIQRGAKVELTSDGVLSLTSPNGTQIWSAQGSSDRQITYAAILNTGNLVLATTESNNAWESFTNPTDTILPTQILEVGSKLSSRLSETDYTIGRFELHLETDGNMSLYTMARPTEGTNEAYWASYTANNSSQLIYNQSGYIYLPLKNGSMFYLSSKRPASTTDYYQRGTLDFDGVFRQYTYPKTSTSNGNWSISWSLPENICKSRFGLVGSGVCGFNSYCQMNQDRGPECLCPPGYTYLHSNDTFGGCKQNFVPQSCERKKLSIADGFRMVEVSSIDWPYADYEYFKLVPEDWCSETCLNDCFCAVAIFSNGECWRKKFPLSGGFMSNASTRKALLKVGNSSIQNAEPLGGKSEKLKKWIIPGSILLAFSVGLNLLLLVIGIYCVRGKKEVKIDKSTNSSGVGPRSFTYKELEEATDGFKEELGKGACSKVYKGVLNGGCLVAVKRLQEVQGNDKEFKAEMSAIGKTNHKNLVQLLGFCDEDTHRLLVYEFMRNGSLDHFLFGKPKLGWSQRVQIAFGIARGLAYLHDDCSTQIIHCDVKPQNILLDDYYVARISDFGLAKLLKSDQTRTITGIRGTRGYVAPEWFKNMSITAKVDVYSFGVMLLEIICCRKYVELEGEDGDIQILSDLAYECCRQNSLHLLVADDDHDARNDSKNLERMVMVALWCIQEDPSFRPSMKKVAQMLDGAAEVLMPPDPSSFITSIT